MNAGGVAEVREKFNLTLEDFPAFFLFVDSWQRLVRGPGPELRYTCV